MLIGFFIFDHILFILLNINLLKLISSVTCPRIRASYNKYKINLIFIELLWIFYK